MRRFLIFYRVLVVLYLGRLDGIMSVKREPSASTLSSLADNADKPNPFNNLEAWENTLPQLDAKGSYKENPDQLNTLWIIEDNCRPIIKPNPDATIDTTLRLVSSTPSASGVSPALVAPVLYVEYYGTRIKFVAQPFSYVNKLISASRPEEEQHFFLDAVTIPMNSALESFKTLFSAIESLNSTMLINSPSEPVRWFFWVDGEMRHLFLRYPSNAEAFRDHLVVDANVALKTWPRTSLWSSKNSRPSLEWRRKQIGMPCKACETNERAYYAVRFSYYLVQLKDIKDGTTPEKALKPAQIRRRFAAERLNALRSFLESTLCKVELNDWLSFSISESISSHSFSSAYIQPLKKKSFSLKRPYRISFCFGKKKNELVSCTSCVFKRWRRLPALLRLLIQRIPGDKTPFTKVHALEYLPSRKKPNDIWYILVLSQKHHTYRCEKFGTLPETQQSIKEFLLQSPAKPLETKQSALELWTSTILSTTGNKKSWRGSFFWTTSKKPLPFFSKRIPRLDALSSDWHMALGAIDRNPTPALVARVVAVYLSNRGFVFKTHPFAATSYLSTPSFVSALEESTSHPFTLEFSKLPSPYPLKSIQKLAKAMNMLKPLWSTDLTLPPQWFFWLDLTLTKLYLRCPFQLDNNSVKELRDYLIVDTNEALESGPNSPNKRERGLRNEGLEKWRFYRVAVPCGRCTTNEKTYHAVNLSHQLVALENQLKGNSAPKFAQLQPRFKNSNFMALKNLMDNNNCLLSEYGEGSSETNAITGSFTSYIQEVKEDAKMQRYRLFFCLSKNNDFRCISCQFQKDVQLPNVLRQSGVYRVHSLDKANVYGLPLYIKGKPKYTLRLSLPYSENRSFRKKRKTVRT